MPRTYTQLALFASEAALPAIPTRRRYIRHQRKHVKWLQFNYCCYTLKECAAQLGLTPGKVLYLCRTNLIKKRAPNKQPHPKKQFAHIPELKQAA